MLSSWIHCCNSARPKALYWRPVHLITLMQAQACFNQQRPALPPVCYLPCPFWWGESAAPVFWGALLRLPPQGLTAVLRRRGQGARLRWRWRRRRVQAWDDRWVGNGCSLGDELAGQGLGHWKSPRAGFLEDVLVECCERVAELCPKFVRGMTSSSLRIDA
jgi:hypothetical protein